MIDNRVRKGYEELKQTKIKYGNYKKTLFHVHTPASYDYKLLKDFKNSEEYEKATAAEIYRKVAKNQLLEEIIKDYAKSPSLPDELSLFKDHKEFYSYLLLGQEILENTYEMVVITDHNTLDGYKKLKFIIDELCKIKTYKYCTIIPGVEITCSDRLHVVGIFNEEKIKDVDDWIQQELISEKSGLMRPSFDVLEYFHNIGGISYIAHINSSDIFKDNKYFSGGYRKKLLSSDHSKYIGLSNISAKEQIQRLLKQENNMSRNFLIDNDAHTIEEISEKMMWVKTSSNTVNDLLDALREYDVAIRLYEPPEPKVSIQGVWIEKEKNGFLKGKDENSNYCARYSPSLNSYIGGRGTGKSTILELIDFVLTQSFDNDDQLFFFSLHGFICILFDYNGEEFLVSCNLPKHKTNIDLIAALDGRDSEKYRKEIEYNKNNLKRNIFKKHIKVYKVLNNNSKIKFVQPKGGKATTIEKLYDKKYSVNKLVEIASSEKISSFIYDLLLNTSSIRSAKNLVRFRARSGLNNFLENINHQLLKRQKEINSELKPYNDKQKDKLKVVYKLNDINDYYFPQKYFRYPKMKDIEKYDITSKEIMSYFEYIVRQISFIKFIKLCLNNQEQLKKFNLSSFSNANRSANLDKTTVNSENEELIKEYLFEQFLKQNPISNFKTYFEYKLYSIDNYSISFNVNAYETNQTKKDYFKDIKTLSLGQKVVAMLNFILGYGDFINNHKPIIIDQPEDNLDSRYIYKNLVNQFRRLKESRQIIIATHNATLVTNSLSENVIVMESDGKYGWMEQSGYTLDYRIRKNIVNIMEGGNNSFRHRSAIYNEILKSN